MYLFQLLLHFLEGLGNVEAVSSLVVELVHHLSLVLQKRISLRVIILLSIGPLVVRGGDFAVNGFDNAAPLFLSSLAEVLVELEEDNFEGGELPDEVHDLKVFFVELCLASECVQLHLAVVLLNQLEEVGLDVDEQEAEQAHLE